MIVDQLHGTLVAYEMRIEDEDTPRKGATFTVSSKQARKNKSTKYKLTSDESNDEEIANFVRKLKRGIGKYKGKLPLKCFSCGKLGHFASKFPYAKNSDGEEVTVLNPTRSTIITRIRTKESLQRRKVSTQKETIAHPVVTPIITVTMILMMTMNQTKYSSWK